MARDVDAVVAVGVNCIDPQRRRGRGPAGRARSAGKPVVVYPNSGELWDAGRAAWYGEPAGRRGRGPRAWTAAGARLVGGCCRVGPDGDRARSRAAAAAALRRDAAPQHRRGRPRRRPSTAEPRVVEGHAAPQQQVEDLGRAADDGLRRLAPRRAPAVPGREHPAGRGLVRRDARGCGSSGSIRPRWSWRGKNMCRTSSIPSRASAASNGWAATPCEPAASQAWTAVSSGCRRNQNAAGRGFGPKAQHSRLRRRRAQDADQRRRAVQEPGRVPAASGNDDLVVVHRALLDDRRRAPSGGRRRRGG